MLDHPDKASNYCRKSYWLQRDVALKEFVDRGCNWR